MITFEFGTEWENSTVEAEIQPVKHKLKETMFMCFEASRKLVHPLLCVCCEPEEKRAPV